VCIAVDEKNGPDRVDSSAKEEVQRFTSVNKMLRKDMPPKTGNNYAETAFRLRKIIGLLSGTCNIEPSSA